MKIFRRSGGFTLVDDNGLAAAAAAAKTSLQPNGQARLSPSIDEAASSSASWSMDSGSPEAELATSISTGSDASSSLSTDQTPTTGVQVMNGTASRTNEDDKPADDPEEIADSEPDVQETAGSRRQRHEQYHQSISVELTLRPRAEDIIYKERAPDEATYNVYQLDNERPVKGCKIGLGSRNFESSTEYLFKHPVSDDYRWRHGLTFQLCSIAVLFNLGTVWRFQSMALENHAGSFVFAYLLCWLFVGLPVLVLEQMVGQFVHKNPWAIWSCVPLLRGITVSQCVISIYLVAMYYIVMAWFGIYFATSFANPLPWNSSTIEICQTLSDGSTSCRNSSIVEQYFRNDVLNLADLDHISSIDWRAIVAVLIATILVILLSLHRQRIFEVVAPILTVIMVTLLIGLLIYACTRTGASDGIVYFFTPQWDQLGSQVWYSALTQVVYTHTIGVGIHGSMSSCNGFKWPVVRYAITSSILALVFSLVSGMAAFALLGNLAAIMNVPIEDAVQLGYGLEYIVISSAVTTTAWSEAWSTTIFAALFVCGTVSPTSYVLNVVAMTRGRFNRVFRRDWMAILSVALVAFIISLVFTTQGGLYFLKIFDAYGVSIPALVCLALETIGLLWIYGLKLFRQDFNLMTSTRAKSIALVSFLTPCIIVAVAIAAFVQFDLVTLDGMEIPAWGHGLGGGLLGLALLPILIYMIYVINVQLEYGFTGKLHMAIKPTSSWGPNEYRTRQTWLTKKVESFSKPTANGKQQRVTKVTSQDNQSTRAETMPDVVQEAHGTGQDDDHSSPRNERSQQGTDNRRPPLDRETSWALY